MKIVQIDETRREIREDELRRLFDVGNDFGLAEARLREQSGKRSVELVFRFTRDHRDVSLDLFTPSSVVTVENTLTAG